jgi:hypothetical protein
MARRARRSEIRVPRDQMRSAEAVRWWSEAGRRALYQRSVDNAERNSLTALKDANRLT